MSIELFTDSLCDITPELIVSWKLHIVSLLVSFKGDENEYLDDQISSQQIYDYVDKHKVLPTTACVSPERFKIAFKEEIDKGNKIIYIGCGSGISGTFQNSVIASKEFPDGVVTCIDSKTLSSGISLLLHKARLFIDEGHTPEEIKELIEPMVPNLSVKFCVDTMDYLYHGGRCSSLAHFFGKHLHIHPVIRMSNNMMTVEAKPRGIYKKAVDYQIDIFLKDLPYIEKDCVFITHSSGKGFDAYNYIYEKLVQYIDPTCLHITTSHSTVSSHCGPGTIGILYILNK